MRGRSINFRPRLGLGWRPIDWRERGQNYRRGPGSMLSNDVTND